MMSITMPYGADVCHADIDWGQCLGTLDIRDAPELANRGQSIRRALEHPIGLDMNIYQTVAPGETVAILVSDMFRCTRVEEILPILVAGLNEAGISDDAITLIFARGTHRAPTPEEQAGILGRDIYRRFQERIFVHDPTDSTNLVYVGTTSRGTRVELNKCALECDRLIATGATVLHYFAGYGGGRKSIVPGIASLDTIAHNHAMNLDPDEDRLNPAVRISALDGNPVAEDMLEAARLVKVDCIINTVLDRHGRIAGVFVGELDAAHRAAARFARDLFAVTIEEQADLVIASSGTAKDFVQSHKALFNAYQAMKPSGRIVFVAKCDEGLGGEQFEKWLRLGDRSRIFAGLREHSEINGQTALSTIEKTPITDFVTGLSHEQVALLRGRKAASLADALANTRHHLAKAGITMPTYYLMPSASYTVPFLA